MKKRFKKSEYFLAGVLALVAAFPLVVDVSTVSTDLSASTLSIKQQALNHFQDYRTNRRDFQESQALCKQLQSEGKDVTCPDINDYNGIHVFLSTHTNAVTPVASTGAVSLLLSDLSPVQKNVLRRYQNIHQCPTTMNTILPGFTALCQSLMMPVSSLQQRIIERKVIKGPTD